MTGLAASLAGGRETGLSVFIRSYLKGLNFNSTCLIAVVESAFLVELGCSVTSKTTLPYSQVHFSLFSPVLFI